MVSLQRINIPLSICKLAAPVKIPADLFPVFFAQTKDEYSLVCPSDSVPASAIAREERFLAIRVVGSLDFSLIGILSPILRVLAEAKISVFASSTFDTDYVLVREELINEAVVALSRAGYEFV